jgi:hypothetical protein
MKKPITQWLAEMPKPYAELALKEYAPILEASGEPDEDVATMRDAFECSVLCIDNLQKTKFWNDVLYFMGEESAWPPIEVYGRAFISQKDMDAPKREMSMFWNE